MQALRIAATGMAAQQMRVDVTSNNIANMSTAAYDGRRASFADLHYATLRAPGALTATSGERLPTGVQLGLGARVASVSVERAQGALRPTDNPLDLAIEGDGFFEVRLPSGESAYTRDGGFRLSAEGEIVTSQGLALADGIAVPAEARRVEIGADGTVSAFFDEEGAEGQVIGTIEIARFVNAGGLEALGDNLFRETVASGAATRGVAGTEGRGTLRQGFLEESSVDVVSEITELIEAQRGYELNARVMSAADDMMAATAQVR